jgi:hypothetical protein
MVPATLLKDGICSRLAGDGVLVAMLGSPDISSAWPDENMSFADTPPGTTEFESLPPITAPPPAPQSRARITFTKVSPLEDPEVPVHDDDYQIDVWSGNERLADAVAARVKVLLDRQPLVTGGLRVTEAYCVEGADLYEPQTRIHHIVLDYHITWIG